MDELDKINRIQETPYGAILIGNDKMCTPTSLCTWDEGRPVSYCRVPLHTLNPVCQKDRESVRLLGCYREATCGGIIRPDVSQRLIQENPHYASLIVNAETAAAREEDSDAMKSRMWYFIVFIIFAFLLMSFLMAMGSEPPKAMKDKKRKIEKKGGWAFMPSVVRRSRRKPTSRSI